MRGSWIAIWLLFFAPLPLLAQGFGGLGAHVEGFDEVVPGRPMAFPGDHGLHADFRIEWWYLTANLKGDDGEDYGVQWTLFRLATRPGETPGWNSPQLWMGHAAVTSKDKHLFAEMRARGGIGTAGVDAQPFDAWINDWHMKSRAAPGAEPLSRLQLTASDKRFGYRLALEADGPLVLHGQEGYSRKSDLGQASYYYSQPFYRVGGELRLGERNVKVAGRAWLDREWSTQPLSPDQSGWEWISLHFDSGEKLMGFRLRQKDGGAFISGSWIDPSGRATPLDATMLKMTPLETASVAGREVPVGWRIELPQQNVDVTLEALNRQSWMATSPAYWEGPVRIAGSHQGAGYLEMTGY